MKLASLACLLLPVIGLHAENFIRVNIQGHLLVIDTDSDAVQRNLQPVNPQAGEVKLPAWLYPFQGAVPLRAHYDVNTGIASGTFASGGTVDQVAGYYGQLLASKGFATGAPMGSPTSKIVSGKNASGTVSAMAGVPFRNPLGGVEITVTFAPTQTKASQRHFEAAWFDDTRGLLDLRDTATGEEYYLDIRSIAEANLNRPGAVKAEGSALPAWFPIYPNARRATVKVIWAFDPNVTYQTRDSIRAVYDYYIEAFKNAGARIHESGIVKSGTPLKDWSAQIVAQMGDDVVDVRVGEIMNQFPMAFASTTPPGGTGIGVSYKVPKR